MNTIKAILITLAILGGIIVSPLIFLVALIYIFYVCIKSDLEDDEEKED